MEEVWDSFWNFGSDPFKKLKEEQQQQAQEQQAQQQQQQPPPEPEPPAGKGDPIELLGLDVWPAAIRLCEYLAAHPHLVAGLDVAELGAGTAGGTSPCLWGPAARQCGSAAAQRQRWHA